MMILKNVSNMIYLSNVFEAILFILLVLCLSIKCLRKVAFIAVLPRIVEKITSFIHLSFKVNSNQKIKYY